MPKYTYSFRPFPHLVFAGIRDVAKKSREFKEYIELTSRVPWLRQMRNKELLYDSSRDVYIKEKNSADPSNNELSIFDDGYFYENQVDDFFEYLKQYELRNSDTLKEKKSIYPISKSSLHEDFLAFEKYEKKKKNSKEFLRKKNCR
jgi:hypothetical protein